MHNYTRVVLGSPKKTTPNSEESEAVKLAYDIVVYCRVWTDTVNR